MRYAIPLREAPTAALVAEAEALVQDARDELQLALKYVDETRHRQRLIACADSLLRAKLRAMVSREPRVL